MHPHAGTDDRSNAVKLPRTVILSGECHDRDADGVGHGPIKPVELPVDRPGCRRVCAEQIDGLLDDNIRDAVHDGSQSRGQANSRHAAQKHAVKAQLRHMQAAVARNTQQHPDHEPRADQLRQAGRHGRARRSKSENSDEQQIQPRVGQRADDEEVKGPFRIAHRAQNTRPHVIDHGGDHTGKIPLQIDDGIGQRVGRRVEQDEHGPGHENAQRRHDRADHDGEQERRVDRLPHHITLPRAVMLRDDDAGAGGQADEKAHDQIDDDQIRAADGGQRRLADQPPEDDRVDHGIQLLEQRPQHDRQEKAGHIRKNRAVKQIRAPGNGLCHADKPPEKESSHTIL